MSSKEYNDILKNFAKLDSDDKSLLVQSIMEMMSTVDGGPVSHDCNAMVKEYTFEDKRPDCPHCKAKANLGFIVKRGFKKNVQRYYCKSCGKFFVATTKTAFEKTRKDSDTWKRFIELTLDGKSLAVCSAECGISYLTAFTWRHKILNAFRVHQDTTNMTGKIEMDEMLISISYKGNHINGRYGSRTRTPGESNNLPRPSYKRGSDNKSKSSKDKACVFCMVKNGNEGYYATVPGVGFMNEVMLDHTVGKHVDKAGAVIVVDKYKTTVNYLSSNNYSYVSLLSNTSENPNRHKPEILGDIHLQHVNSFHSHLRTFLAKYRGVSTKYLENYVSLFVWLSNIKAAKQSRNVKKVTICRAAESDCYISRKGIKVPAVPLCA